MVNKPSMRVAVVTGSRAEYGLLYWLLRDLRDAPDIELQLLVTGMHLSHEFGLTVNEIERDGFQIARRVEMLLSSDTPGSIAKSIGLGVIGMSDALAQMQPDIVLLLGDRFEILSAAQACLVHNFAVAHIGGGDTTEGAIDESIRHAISKMSHLHFVTNDLAAHRVRQLGEDPARVHVVGNPGLDHVRRLPLLAPAALEQALGAELGSCNLLVTFHPVTLEPGESERQFNELLAALDHCDDDTIFWMTHPNADSGGRGLSVILDAWVAARSKRAHVYVLLGQQRYLSLLAHADAVVGNSSSGLCEAPSFGTPAVNIGSRQLGRLAGPSVFHCAPDRESIRLAIDAALASGRHTTVNPYGDGQTASRIIQVLRDVTSPVQLLKKRFHLLGDSCA